MKEKELVTIRRRPLKGGGCSLSLDYMIDGVRTRENLKMYLLPGKTRQVQGINADTMNAALAAKAKRTLEIQNRRAGIPTRTRDMLLTDYLDGQERRYMERGQPVYAEKVHYLADWIRKYGRKVSLHTVDKEYILSLCHFMRKGGLSEGTVHLYFSVLGVALNSAYRDDLIAENPIKKIDRSQKPKKPESVREYLTLEEIRTLIATPCSHESAKQAFLFACFTGLRISDIETLDWSQIRRNDDGWQVQARMHKNRRLIYIPLTENALAWLPSPMKKEGRIWDLLSRPKLREAIARWVKGASIGKHITFHSSRHTYATLLLTYGADIYTVSSLLGHASVNTTQIYAKIVDENRRRTASLIPLVKK